MKILVIATKNRGKLAEFKELLGEWPLEIKSLLDFPKIEICEKGSTFEENAALKARIVAGETGFAAVGDDSGLEVKALGGRPGIYTARYAGPDATDEENIQKLLFEMKDLPREQRQARFVCSLALAFPDGKIFIESGLLEGFIDFEPKGANGFGYDPVFYLPGYGKTLAQIPEEEKNRISHRAKAVEKIKKYLSLYTG
ncbi:XTP/dITP diphosphatase [Thermoanaerobacterium sp. DL9XJH110]|uniref:XTP/dITP diphosphatase n=1 Tax=Thermoanaerobacterium sp. DL9XJH110 TaxID=3386643 RepID=UPI003BB73FB8